MKGNEITREQMELWKKDGWFPVACRLCGEVMLFPKPAYNETMFERGYECGCHKRQLARFGL